MPLFHSPSHSRAFAVSQMGLNWALFMSIPLWAGAPSSISMSSQIDSGVGSNVSVSCQRSGFESLDRFGARPSKRAVYSSSSSDTSFCRCCTWEIAASTWEIALATVSEALVSCTKASSRFRVASMFRLLWGAEYDYARIVLLQNSSSSHFSNANICKCGRLRVHLLYQIKHIRFRIRWFRSLRTAGIWITSPASTLEMPS